MNPTSQKKKYTELYEQVRQLTIEEYDGQKYVKSYFHQ